MSTYSDRAFSALAQFNGRLSTFTEALKATRPDPAAVSAKTIEELTKTATRARNASDAISRSLTLIDITALDVVDMQVRLQGETAKLASALRDLGKSVAKHPAVNTAFGEALVGLDEAAQMVASAVFPSAVQGLRDANVKLWDFEKLLWKRYTDILTDVVQRGSVSPEMEEKIQAIADQVWQAFAEVNSLLNDLAESRANDAQALRRRLEAAPERLTAALRKRASDWKRRMPMRSTDSAGHQGVGRCRQGCRRTPSRSSRSPSFRRTRAWGLAASSWTRPSTTASAACRRSRC